MVGFLIPRSGENRNSFFHFESQWRLVKKLFVSPDQTRLFSSSLEGNIAFLKAAGSFPKAFRMDIDRFLYKIKSLGAQSLNMVLHLTKKTRFSSDLQSGEWAGELLGLTHAPRQMRNMCTRKLVLLKRKQTCKGSSCGIFSVASSENPTWSRLPWIHSWCCNNKKGRERHFFLHWWRISVKSISIFYKHSEGNHTSQWPMSMTKEADRSIQLLRQWTKHKNQG